MITRYDLKVRGYELDSFGHVNNSVYFNYLEEARWQMFNNSAIASYLIKNELFPAVIESKIKYIRELKAFVDIYIMTEWSYSGIYIVAKHKIYLTDGDILCTKATVKMILLSNDRVIYDIPDELKKELSMQG
ncbi:MAG TPA: thioesterase family protein [Tissierellales bacterium]|nr:thioesterase family protein [Tissierellales bacterium]